MTSPDITSSPVDLLDFQPTCQVDVYEMKLKVRHSPCAQPAVWIGVAPCGHDDYFCETHHSDQRSFMCNTCGQRDMLLATYRWIRL